MSGYIDPGNPAATITGMPGRLLRLIYGRRQVRWLTIVVQRVWPTVLALYLLLIVASPYDKPIYGFGDTWVTTLFLVPTAAMLFVAATVPAREVITAAAMAMTTWSLMGRGATYALDTGSEVWARAIGAGAYVVMTLAVVLLYFVHAALVVEQRVRGDEAI